MRKRWTNKKAKRVIIVMSSFWYCTLGMYWLGKLLPILNGKSSIFLHWGNGLMLTLIGGLFLSILIATVMLLHEWINKE